MRSLSMIWAMGGDWEADAERAAAWDAVLCEAVALAAGRIVPRDGESEVGEQRHLVPALNEAFASVAGVERVVTGRRPQAPDWLPDWEPRPGNVDLLVGDAPSPAALLRAGIEAKSRTHAGKLGETIYDLFKMAALRRMAGVEAAYIIVAAPRSAFASGEPGAPLFDSPPGEPEEWHSAYFMEEWTSDWASLLAESSGKPQRVPRTLSLHRVCTEAIAAFPGWEIRVLRVENPLSEWWLDFGSDGWPTHLDPDPWEGGPRQIPDSMLRPADVPPPDCEEGLIHRFALSLDGYAREGTHGRCARLANEARQRWDESGELPGDLRSLRSCLFFEQRRAHHSGYGFGEIDPRTLDYVRALVEAIRTHGAEPPSAIADLGPLDALPLEVATHERHPALGWRLVWRASGEIDGFWVVDQQDLQAKLAARNLLPATRPAQGSLAHIRWYVNERPDLLNAAIFTALPSLAREARGDISWVSPLKAEGYVEAWNERFLEKLGLLNLREDFCAFWPFRGTGTPHWDALATVPLEHGVGVVLVEAKSHRGEFVKPDDETGAQGESLEKIRRSFACARRFYCVPPETPPWESTYYQVGNRLAHLYWMGQKAAVRTWLVWVLLLDDPIWPDRLAAHEWHAAFEDVKRAVGLRPGHPFEDRIAPVYLPPSPQL